MTMAMGEKMEHAPLEMIRYGNDPAVLLLADSDEGMRRSRAAADAAGCRVSDAAGLQRAIERIDRQVAADLILVDIERDHGTRLDQILDRLEAGARGGRLRSVVAAPPELIDAIASRTSHRDVHHLCDPLEEERVAAIRLASMRRPSRLQDVGKEKSHAQLQQLSEEVGRIASALAALKGDTGLQDEDGEEIAACEVRAIIRARRLRDQYFDESLFADPAWDILLDLMAAKLEGKQVAVSSLCIAASVPPTTALRWIKALTDQGLLERVADAQDGRRVFIRLSPAASRRLSAYLRAVRRISPLAI